MSDFIRKYGELREEALNYIINFIKNNGNRYEFVNPEEMEKDDFSDFAWQLPQATYVGKHEYTFYYAITSITFEDDNIWFNGVSIGEDSDDYNFGATEMDLAGLCDCADNLIIKQ